MYNVTWAYVSEDLSVDEVEVHPSHPSRPGPRPSKGEAILASQFKSNYDGPMAFFTEANHSLNVL